MFSRFIESFSKNSPILFSSIQIDGWYISFNHHVLISPSLLVFAWNFHKTWPTLTWGKLMLVLPEKKKKNIYIYIYTTFATTHNVLSCVLWRCGPPWIHYYSPLTTCHMVSCDENCDIFEAQTFFGFISS